MVWLGIDLGTQGVRAVAVSHSGTIVGTASCLVSSQREGGRHEQSPGEWWLAVQSACRKALSAVPGQHVTGLAVDGTSGTILLADASGKPLTPALMYDDARASEEAKEIGETQIPAVLGHRVQPSWALPKLLWLLRNCGGEIRHARAIHQVDYINRRLAGHDVPSDSSNSLKTGYDLVLEAWPREALVRLGIPDHVLPEVVRPGVQIGTVCREAADLTGIPAGTAIFAGMTDGCAAQLAAGAVRVGNWNSVLGTTLVLKGVNSAPLRDPSGIVYCHRLPDGKWLPGAASSTGGGVLLKHFKERDLQLLDAQAATREPASVIAYPLAGRGERFPFCASEAEGFVLGEPADENDLYAALLRGVAFIERLCFDYLALLGAPVEGELTLTGGATRSRYWCQLRADILGRTVLLPECSEPALGMAILAASGGQSLCDVASRMVRIRERIDPRPAQLAPFCSSYIKLLNELRRRGWIDSTLADFAERRACASE